MVITAEKLEFFRRNRWKIGLPDCLTSTDPLDYDEWMAMEELVSAVGIIERGHASHEFTEATAARLRDCVSSAELIEKIRLLSTDT